MPIRLTRVLSVLCMLLCMSLLALLLAASTATTGEALRRIDVHAQYLENLSTALDEWLLQSSLRDAGQAAALDTLTQRIAASIAAIGDDLDAALHPATAIDRLQHAALTAFAYAGRHRTPASGEPAYAQLETAGARIAEQAAAFADSHGRYAAGLAYIDTDMSALVDRLRSAGRNDEADSVFRSADLMRQYLQSGQATSAQPSSVWSTGCRRWWKRGARCAMRGCAWTCAASMHRWRACGRATTPCLRTCWACRHRHVSC